MGRNPEEHRNGSLVGCGTAGRWLVSGRWLVGGRSLAGMWCRGAAGHRWLAEGIYCAKSRSQRLAALGWAGLGWAGLGWAGLGWAGLGLAGVG